MAKSHVVTWNIEGLRSKWQELDILRTHFNPIAFCIQDTRLTKDIEKFYHMTGYKPYFHSINNRASGVLIYVRNDIPQSEIPLASPLQAVAVRVTVGGKTYIHLYTSHLLPPQQ